MTKQKTHYLQKRQLIRHLVKELAQIKAEKKNLKLNEACFKRKIIKQERKNVITVSKK